MSQQATTDRLDWSERIRQVGVGILSGGIAGLVVGIGARINMRIVTLSIHQAPVLTLATLSIVFMGLLLGICPGILYVMVRKYLPGPGLLKGIAFGILLFLMIGLPVFLQSSSPDSELSLGPPYLAKSLFGALFLIYGIILALAEARLRRYMPAPPQQSEESIKPVLLYMSLGCLGLLGLFLLASLLLQGLLGLLFHA